MAWFSSTNSRVVQLIALLAVSISVLANGANPVGDWWIIYGDGVPGKNIMYVADRTSVVPSKETKGAQQLAVTLVYEELGKPMIDVYNMEIQCSTGKFRFVNGQSVARLGSLRHLKVSNKWEGAKEPWLKRSSEFVCAKQNKDIVAMGKMEYMQMINVAQQMFFQLAPIQEKNQTMDNLDSILENK